MDTPKGTIVTLGPACTNSHEVADTVNKEMFGSKRQLAFVPSNPDILSAVRDGFHEVGVVPVANGSAGPVMDILKSWMQGPDDRGYFLPEVEYLKEGKRVFVNGVRELVINHNLLVSPDVMQIEELEKIVSHPQALSQCGIFLTSSGIPTSPSTSTAEAAASVARAGSGCKIGAIASDFAANSYGLKILKTGIADDSSNSTQFYVVSTERSLRTGNDRTALILWLANEPGSLFGALASFASGNINMRSLHSIPLGQLTEVAFYVEIEGYEEDPLVKSALTLLASRVEKLVIMGSYPV